MPGRDSVRNGKRLDLRKDTVALVRRTCINPNDSFDLTLRKLVELYVGEPGEPEFTTDDEWCSPVVTKLTDIPVAEYKTGRTAIVVSSDAIDALDYLRHISDDTTLSYDSAIKNMVRFLEGG